MPNNLNASFSQYWSRRMQRKMYKVDIFRAIASFEEEPTLKRGDRVHRPYRSDIQAQTYSRGTAFTVQDLTATDETLIVDQAKIVPFYIDDLDELQANYKLQNEFADDAAVKLGNLVDAAVLAEVLNATSKVDDYDLGGTAGNGITATTGNIQKIFSTVSKKLNRLNVDKNNRFGVLSPDLEQILIDYLAGKETALGDNTGMNGSIGKYYKFDLFGSNNLTWTGELLIGTQPTDGDTVTINGVVFTFKTTLGSTAGNVLIGADAAAARVNLAALFNAPTVTTAQGVALTTANVNKLYNMAMVDNASTKVTVTAKGYSYLQPTETLTAAGDIWTAAKQIQHNVFGLKGAVDVVIQSRPKVEIKDVPDKLGKNIAPWTLYGLKTFQEGKDILVDVQIRSDAF